MDILLIAKRCPQVPILGCDALPRTNKWEVKFSTACGPRVVVGDNLIDVCELIQREADTPQRPVLVRV